MTNFPVMGKFSAVYKRLTNWYPLDEIFFMNLVLTRNFFAPTLSFVCRTTRAVEG